MSLPPNSTVEVWIYDLSKGLARSMSMPLLGKQIDGIWHTAIVAYGKEYFFGGDSIECCTPGGTILGAPNAKVSLGSTEIPYEIFHEHLRELSQTTFRPCDYHLLKRNCNNFSSEVAQFLTGNDIPSYITNLPDEVLSTPFGQMLRPMLDSMTVNPGAGAHRVFGESEPSSRIVQPAATSQGARNTQPSSHINTPQPSVSPPSCPHPNCVTFCSSQEFDVESLCEKEAEKKLVQEIVEFVAMDNVTWSISPAHVKCLGGLISQCQTPEKRKVLWEILQLLVLKPDSLAIIKRCDNSVFIDQLSAADMESLKCICNTCAILDGYKLCLTKRRQLLEQLPSLLETYMKDVEHMRAIASVIYNISVHHKLVDDLDIQFTCALVEFLNTHLDLDVKTVELILKSLLNFMSANTEVRMLAFTMGLDTSRYTETAQSSQEGELAQLVQRLSNLKVV